LLALNETEGLKDRLRRCAYSRSEEHAATLMPFAMTERMSFHFEVSEPLWVYSQSPLQGQLNEVIH